MYYCFTTLVQRILNSDEIQEKVLLQMKYWTVLLYGLPFCIYMSYKL